jgi:hypothetical protein
MGILKNFFFIAVFILSGCSSVSHVRISDYVTDKPTNPVHVEVFFQTPPRRARPIAYVTAARIGENAVYAVEDLKDEAGSLGADAITNLEMNYTSSFFPSLHVSGIAVKYE